MSSILKRFRKKRYRKVADPATLWYDEGDMDNFLFPEASEILHEAIQRHQGVFPYVVEAIDLAHLAYGRERDQSSRYVPGIPHIRRVRNDINDDAWRFLRMIGEPLVSAGLIRAFVSVTNHDLVILPDGLIARLKKGAPPDGMTSNYPTPNVQRMATASERVTLFCEATPLDEAIQSGVTFDIVYVAASGHGWTDNEMRGVFKTTDGGTTTTVELGTGDVQVTLEWGTAADLDLAVTDPTGERVSFGNPGPTASGGELDVDSNVSCDDEGSIENIFWPPGGAPAGTYTVKVTGFTVESCSQGAQSGDYTLTIRVAGQPEQVITDSVAENEEDSFEFRV